jgi:predicted dienelactone hydrolase
MTSGGLPALPVSTGPFAVGRVTVHWTDRSRSESVATDRGPRELMVDVWYPADAAAGPAAAYLDPSAFNQPQSAERLKGLLRTTYEGVKAGHVRTHAIQGAPFARSAKRSPVLVFSHGGGELRETYAAQLEDLASHGYAVAAITHTYDSALAIFPDGRHVVLAPKRWAPAATSAIEGLPPSEEANPECPEIQFWTGIAIFASHTNIRVRRGPTDLRKDQLTSNGNGTQTSA